MSKLKIHSPFDLTLISEIASDDEGSLEKKLALAHETFHERKNWLQTYDRIAILKKTAELLTDQQNDFAMLIAREGGKPLKDAKVEVTRAIDGLLNAAEVLRNFSGNEIPMGLTKASENRWAFTTKEPIGVVAAISAFNHPLNLIVHQVAPAVAVGCPVIVKPAQDTPLSCIELVNLFKEAGLGEGWCQTLITSDVQLSEKLAVDKRISFLSFIGSAKVGWHLRSQLPPGTRLALEHGGVAPVIVHQSADLDQAVKAITKGGFYHAGQVCVSVQRVFVHKSIFSKFVSLFKSEMEKLKVGDPTIEDTDVGPLIRPKEVERVTAWIQEAITMGADLIGGGHLSETTLKPAILLRPSLEAKVSKEEVFGPVVCVYEYEDMDQAIEISNSLPYAFQASVFSKEIDPAMKAAKGLNASAVFINDHTAFRTDWMPFAGRGQSGYGVGGIPYTMKDMTEEKMVVLRYAVPFPPV